MPNLNRFDILSISIFALSILPYRYRYRYRYSPKSPYRYRYRYFWNYLIDIDIDIFQNFPIDIEIDIFQNHFISPYRYRYFSKVSIYRQSIFYIDILTRRRSNKNVFYRCTRGRSNKMCFTGGKMPFLSLFHGKSFYTVHYNSHKCRKRYC